MGLIVADKKVIISTNLQTTGGNKKGWISLHHNGGKKALYVATEWAVTKEMVAKKLMSHMWVGLLKFGQVWFGWN